jgi:transposase-like protein
MSRKRYTAEQIIQKLRQAEVESAKGRSVGEVAKQLGITDQTYYRWRKEYGGLKIDRAKRLKKLERENARIKKVVADLTLDTANIKEAANPNW